MNRKMIRLARGAKWGGRGASGLRDSAAACSAARPARARWPKPHAATFRNSRRRVGPDTASISSRAEADEPRRRWVGCSRWRALSASGHLKVLSSWYGDQDSGASPCSRKPGCRIRLSARSIPDDPSAGIPRLDGRVRIRAWARSAGSRTLCSVCCGMHELRAMLSGVQWAHKIGSSQWSHRRGLRPAGYVGVAGPTRAGKERRLAGPHNSRCSSVDDSV